MKRKILLIPLALLLAMSLVATACPAPPVTPPVTPPPEKVFEWQFQSYMLPGTTMYELLDGRLDKLETITGGRLVITLHPIGALIGWTEMLEATGRRVMEVSAVIGSASTGIDPGFSPLSGIPILWGGPREAAIWLGHFGGAEIAKKAYAKHNVHYVGTVVVPSEPMMSTKPLRTIDDFKGVMVRTTLGMAFDLFGEIGAVPISIPGGELYSALDTGIVDAGEWLSLGENFDGGLHEVTDYVLWPGIHAMSASADITVNMDAWAELPEDLKAAFEAIVGELRNDWDKTIEAADWLALEKMVDYGLEHTTLSEADFEKLTVLAVEVAEAYKAKSPLAEEVITSYMDYLRVIGRL